MFELRHLRAFVAIGEELHFGRAAQRLRMTQPPLSQLLKQLESQVGAQLVRRTTRHVELTPSGSLFLERARAILSAAQHAARDAARAADGHAGKLVCGFVPSAAYQFLVPMITAFRKDFPDVELQFREMTSGRQLEALRRATIDIAILRTPSVAANFDKAVVLREPLVVALPNAHPLAGRTAITLHELRAQKMVAFDPDESPYFSRRLHDLFAEDGTQPIIVQHAVLPSMLAFVAAGVGVALVPASVQSAAPAAVTFKPLRAKHPPIELAAVWLRDNKTVLIRNWLRVVAPRLTGRAG